MTYSIVARDPATGAFGVAVQSHWFAVGAAVAWARPGVGAVATQAAARIDYGPRGLTLMEDGLDAGEALSTLVGLDPAGPSRQVAMVDVGGRAAAWTGADCMRFASDATGGGVSCQANIMAAEGVPEAMLAAWDATAEGMGFARRLTASLHAAEALGGDLRGRQSAALLIVPATGDPWQVDVSLRVDDHPEPLGELGRLLSLHEAYTVAGDADSAAAAGDTDAAAAGYRRAGELVSEAGPQAGTGALELRFWAALGTAHAGDDDTALAALRTLISAEPAWRELLARLTPEQAPAAARLLQRLG